MESPRTAFCQPGEGTQPSPPKTGNATGTEPGSAWRSEVDRALGDILKRVASVAHAIVNMEGGIANIMGELKAMSDMLRHDAGARPHANTAQMQGARSKHDDWQHAVSQSNEPDMVQDITTPNCPRKEPTPPQVQPQATKAKYPIVVDWENTSNQSGDKNERGGLRTPQPDSIVKRVHSQPRQRVVLCAKRLLGVPASAGTAETSTDASRSAVRGATKYKDPPGYENARDFGDGEQPHYRPPSLQPKTHGVSIHFNPKPYS